MNNTKPIKWRVYPDAYGQMWNTKDRHIWCLSIEENGAGRYAIRDIFGRLNRLTEEFEYEPLPSSRTDEWIETHTYPTFEEAERVAERLVNTRVVNGRTAQQIADERHPRNIEKKEQSDV